MTKARDFRCENCEWWEAYDRARHIGDVDGLGVCFLETTPVGNKPADARCRHFTTTHVDEPFMPGAKHVHVGLSNASCADCKHWDRDHQGESNDKTIARCHVFGCNRESEAFCECHNPREKTDEPT